MSRIGRKPIVVPAGVDVTIDGSTVKVKGPKGELVRNLHPDMKIIKEDNVIRIERPSDIGSHRALHGLTRALVANMVQGVTEGYSKALEIKGVGYRAALQGRKLVMQLGYSHPVEIDPPEGVDFEVPAPTKIIVRGTDKQMVGEIAARIRQQRPPEPYNDKGIHYEGEQVRRKVGKTGKAAK
ncbi:MAG: 50S ribosomal protein L6 [Firmicutes bacterium]|jgi:large subunit ribosomal protein L6|nr:50S ribosomal protein L6 [Bacillota bacterium]